MGDVAAKAERAGEQAHESEWLDHAIRIGLVAYGVVHLMVGWLAVQLALGDKEESADNAGMVLLVVWRLLEFALGFQDESDTKKRWRKRATSLGKAILYGALAWSAIKTGVGSGSSGGTDSTTAKVMNLPGGQILVGLVGLSIIGFGAVLIYRGWSEKFTEHLDAEGQSGKEGSTYILLGKVGYIAKGIAIGIVGGLFTYAAITHDAKKSGGLDQALQKVLEQPFGQILLIVIGLGIACYGLFSFARAWRLSR